MGGVSGFNPFIDKNQGKSTDQLIKETKGSLSSAPDSPVSGLNSVFTGEAESAMNATIDSIFNGGDGYKFEPEQIAKKIKTQFTSNLKSMVQKKIEESILNLFFDDTAATAKRTMEGTAESVKNTTEATVLQTKLAATGAQALMELATTGEISQATLSQQLADIVNTGVNLSDISSELVQRNNKCAEENMELTKQAEQLQAKLEEKYSSDDKKIDMSELFKDKTTEEILALKPEDAAGNEDIPEGMTEDEDFAALQEILGKLQVNAQEMVTISEALAGNSGQLQSTQAQAETKGAEIEQDGQQQAVSLAQKFQMLANSSSTAMMNKATENATEETKAGVDGSVSAGADRHIAGTQTATGTPMLSNMFTADTGRRLLTKAGLNFAASATNAAFGGKMYGAAVKDLLQGKSLSSIIINNLKQFAMNSSNKLIAQIAPNIENPFEGTIFQDTFASMTNVSGWMQEASQQVIEKPFTSLEENSE